MESKALNYVFYEILDHVLRFSENPSEFGHYLTQKIRELLGVKTVLITSEDSNDNSKLLSVYPQRRFGWANKKTTLHHLNIISSSEVSGFITKSKKTNSLSDNIEQLEIEICIVIPLISGTRKEGTLFLMDIMDDNNISSIINLLEKQSGVFALILRNARMYNDLEIEVKKRTSELQIQNEEYLVLNEELQATNQQLEFAKRKAEESDELKSAFLANMSHEIRTPMNGILGFTELLAEGNTSDSDREKFIKIIKSSGDRMLNTINSIIEISRIETDQIKPSLVETDLNKQLSYFQSFFSPETNKKDIELSIKPLRNLSPYIYTDKYMLDSILTNLIKNAIKYSDSGKIDVGVEPIEKDDKISLLFTIKDTGIGIPEEKQEGIFNRFIQADMTDTRSYEGSGLGLSIVKAFVEMLEGKIWLESEENKGTCFYFTHPYLNAYVPGEHTDDLVQKTQLSTKKKLKVLIVEDNEHNIEYLTAILDKYAKDIIVAKNGYEGVEASELNPDIDLILMDIRLPIMNGLEATKKIREFNKDVIIIAQTAYALSGDSKPPIDAGCNDYLSKPIKISSLTNMISKYFG